MPYSNYINSKIKQLGGYSYIAYRNNQRTRSHITAQGVRNWVLIGNIPTKYIPLIQTIAQERKIKLDLSRINKDAARLLNQQ